VIIETTKIVTMKKTNLFLAAGMAVMMASSCANSENNSNGSADTNAMSTDSLTPYDSATTVANPADTASNTPISFALKAGAGGMMEVELGNISQTNAQHARVKSFGAMMVKDHTMANKELMALSQQKSFNIPSTLPAESQMHINELKALKGADFDKKYMDMMVKDHKKTIDLFEEAAQHSTDADIKAFAAKNLPALKMHLDSAQAIEKAVK
jgi:putative membrane protein